MTRIKKNEVKNIAECNLLHDIINTPKRAKILNIHYSPILYVCMNTRRGKVKFKIFHIPLGSGCSSTIVTGRLVDKLYPEKDAPMQWHTQDGNITTDLKVNIDFTLTALSATHVVTWKCHVDDSDKGRYDIILGQYLLTQLGLNIKFSEHVIKADDGPFYGSTTHMVDLSTYIFKDLNIGKITPEESFTNVYIEEVYGSEHVRTATKLLHVILYAKYEKSDLHKVMENQCQHSTITQRN